MSDSPDNVVQLGGGGLLYQDARDAVRERAQALIAEQDTSAEDLAPDPPPWADRPEPVQLTPAPEPEPPKQSVVGVKQPPKPEEPKKHSDVREAVSTVLELAGIGLLITTGFLIAVWVGTLIAGLCLVVLGVATSRRIGG